MSRYIYLDQSATLPLLDKNLIFVNPLTIIISSSYRDQILSSVSQTIKNQISIGWTTGTLITYPRFDLENYFYKIKPNPIINILPNSQSPLDTETLFDSRSLELYRLSNKYEKVYLFWSGGIDSTVMLSAVLKNWPNTEKLVVVLNQHSITEHSSFYQNFILEKLSIVLTDDFFNNKIKFNHENLYVTGDLGGPLITFDDGYDNFMKCFPEILNEPWKKNIDKIIKYFSANSNKELAKYAVREAIKTSSKSRIVLETVHDFLWWIEFNWGYDTDLVYMLWQYQDLDESVDTKKFMEENVFYWFNSIECQNWTVSLSGTGLRGQNDIFKYAFKKYIYDFDNDYQYFKYKKKEISTPKNLQVLKNKRIVAVDTDYNLYYQNIKV